MRRVQDRGAAMTYSSRRRDDEGTSLGVFVEDGQSSLEQVEAALDVDVPALIELLVSE